MKHPIALFLMAAIGLAACAQEDDGTLYGYSEGKFRLLAPESSGRIVTLAVADGDRLKAGQLVAELDSSLEQAALDQAEAQAEASAARLMDAELGGRTPEVEAARKQIEQAEATAREAQIEVDRVRPLYEQGNASKARLDSAIAVRDTAKALVAERTERLAIVQLPARDNALKALEAEVKATRAALQSARAALAKRTVHAPTDGRVERLLRRVGETAGPTAPVVRYLSDGDMLAIMFIPEPELAAFKPGDRLQVACDACADGLMATVTNISDRAEYTSPEIFSDKERARLVFRAEARFDGRAPPSGTPLFFRRAE